MSGNDLCQCTFEW